MTDEPRAPRFLTPTQVAEELNVKPNQVHALIKAGGLRALQVGGRGM
ncbi:helix-turn-helix domain-containing protein [Pseudarthrobacter sp. NIBRBAC000502770]